MRQAAMVLVIAWGVLRMAGAPAAASEREKDAAMAALLLLRERFVRSVLPTRREDMEAIHRIAAEHAASMDATGRWNDLHYDSGDRAIWSGAAHLDRVLRMAKSARLRREAGRPDAAMTAQAVTALKAWTDADPQNPNWWWNRIGVPELVGEIACLLWDDLPTDQRSAVIRILERSKMDRMTGANLTWCAINRVLLGCLSGSEQVTREAYDRLYEEVRIVGAQEEGIQADYSFHQHGKQFYSGGYGLFFANDVGRFIYIAHGTPFEIPSAKRAVFDGYMLDGMRWMTWGNVLDYSTMGRVITRPNVLAAPTDWSLGPISPAGPAYSLGNVVRLLAELPGPRQAEYAAYAADLAQSPNAPVFEGNRHFWRSDYMAHRRAEYLATVKMFSTRTLNGEIVNGEGRKSHHLSDGANFLYITGQEYKDIFPAWDWQKVPGTTAEQVGDGSAQQMNTIEPKPVGTRGWTDFVGGVSDGRYGLCVMHLQRGALSARKAWFFFDDAYACLGTGITIQNEHPAVTTVNQTHLDGPVRAAGKASPLTPGKRYELDGAAWVHHGRVGYVFLESAPVRLSILDQTGRWSDLGSGPDTPITLPVFKLWIDHGPACRDAGYQYLVLPGASAEQTARQAAAPTLKVLANRIAIQAVWNPSPQLAAIAFWEPGTVDTPLGPIAVDQACLVLAQPEGESIRVTASNPAGEALAVEVRIGERSATLSLPGGDAGGASIQARLR